MLMNGLPLTQICQKPGSPSLSKVYEWIRTNKEFADKILTARKIAAQTYLDRMITELESADNSNIGVLKEKLQHYRWLSSKLIAIYGDKDHGKSTLINTLRGTNSIYRCLILRLIDYDDD